MRRSKQLTEVGPEMYGRDEIMYLHSYPQQGQLVLVLQPVTGATSEGAVHSSNSQSSVMSSLQSAVLSLGVPGWL